MTEVTFDKDLTPLKQDAKRRVDTAAEQERQRRWITPGDGQAQEYGVTRDEAVRIADDSNPSDSDYPQLAAERDAQNEALETNKTLADVGQEVRNILAQTNGQDGAAIKKTRRKAKMLIDAATTPAEIETAKDIDWSSV